MVYPAKLQKAWNQCHERKLAIIAKGRKFAAQMLEAAESDIEFKDGSFRVTGTDKAIALVMLGLSPFIVRAIPDRVMPRTFGPSQVFGTGVVSMMLMLVTGVTGPLLDTMFLRSSLERKQIIATKACCQLFSHGFKLLYFGALIEQAGQVELWFLAVAVASSMIGTSLGKLLLERLSDKQFRVWSNRLITVLACYYVGYGLVLLTGIA